MNVLELEEGPIFNLIDVCQDSTFCFWKQSAHCILFQQCLKSIMGDYLDVEKTGLEQQHKTNAIEEQASFRSVR